MKINLRDFYPFYEMDEVIEVSDEVYEMLRNWKREDAAYYRRLFRQKAHYSLDRLDGMESNSLCFNPPPYEIISDRLAKRHLYTAIASLPGKQAKRLYAYFFLDMSVYEIAAAENICHQTVSRAITRALITLKKNLKNLL